MWRYLLRTPGCFCVFCVSKSSLICCASDLYAVLISCMLCVMLLSCVSLYAGVLVYEILVAEVLQEIKNHIVFVLVQVSLHEILV